MRVSSRPRVESALSLARSGPYVGANRADRMSGCCVFRLVNLRWVYVCPEWRFRY